MTLTMKLDFNHFVKSNTLDPLSIFIAFLCTCRWILAQGRPQIGDWMEVNEQKAAFFRCRDRKLKYKYIQLCTSNECEE